METIDRSSGRLLAARIVLGMATALLIALQFSSTQSLFGRQWFFENWKDIGEGIVKFVHGGANPSALLFMGVFSFTHLLILVQPFLVGFYSRAGLLVWIVRLMAVGPWVWWCANGEIFNVLQTLQDQGGFERKILAILILVPVGLFLVPTQRRGEEK
ncbi:MAG: hypothetical protein QM755_02235 [Luteolibacter sp.]